MHPLDLLDACEHVYAYPGIKAGPDGRDAASVERVAGEAVLVFRGTLTEGPAAMLDWLNDLRAELVYRSEYPGLVHAGFAASLYALWPLLPTCRGKVTVTGHSKGGALALLCGVRLARAGCRVKVVTFAAPRAGDERFANSCGDLLEIDRYENPRDLVPHLPPLDYAAAGFRLTPSPRWQPPRGVVENHALATGYRPWIAGSTPPAARAVAA